MSAVIQLTNRAIVLTQGKLAFVGSPYEAVKQYIGNQQVEAAAEFDVRCARRSFKGTGDVKIQLLRFERGLSHFAFLEPISYTIKVKAERPVDRLRVGMTVYKRDGTAVGNCFSTECEGLTTGEEREIAVTLSDVRLAPGSYFCGVAVGKGSHRTTLVEYDVVSDTLFFEVMPEKTGTGSMAIWYSNWGPIVFPDLSIEKIPN